MVEASQAQGGCKAVVRKPAPAFKANAWFEENMTTISLEQFKGKYVVLFFWPLDFTFVCPTEICQFSDASPEFDAINCQVIGVSIDSAFTHSEYTKKPRAKGGLGPMKIPMVADLTKDISKNYGCLIPDGDDAGVAFRATYIIDPEGTVRHVSISDLPVGRNTNEVLRLVKAFQYSDEHGEVCPSGWEPGKATMPTDHASAKLAAFWEEEHAKK